MWVQHHTHTLEAVLPLIGSLIPPFFSWVGTGRVEHAAMAMCAPIAGGGMTGLG
jgi:hypothetical protein